MSGNELPPTNGGPASEETARLETAVDTTEQDKAGAAKKPAEVVTAAVEGDENPLQFKSVRAGEAPAGTDTAAEAPKVEAPAGATAEAAEAANANWKQRLKPSAVKETWTGSSTGVKFGRVIGTGAGVAMVYDGVFHGKRGEQDRSTLGRLAEVAAGVGVVGVALAAGGKGR